MQLFKDALVNDFVAKTIYRGLSVLRFQTTLFLTPPTRSLNKPPKPRENRRPNKRSHT